MEELSSGLANLCALVELDFSSCQSLRKIPKGLGRVLGLKKLDKWKCEDLDEISPRLSSMCALENLNFSKCRSLRKLGKNLVVQ